MNSKTSSLRLFCWRRGSESNRRIKVLQTFRRTTASGCKQSISRLYLPSIVRLIVRFPKANPPDLQQDDGPAFLSKHRQERLKKPRTCQNLADSQDVFAARFNAL